MVASELFRPEDRAAISKAVSEAEKKSAGEIVPVVATRSDRYERAEGLFGLWTAGLALTLAWLALQGVEPKTGEWETGWKPTLGLVEVLLVVAAGWCLGVFLAARVPFLKRICAGPWMMRPRVEAAAEEAFGRLSVRRTKAATGVVIYVSLFERMVSIRADRAIAEKVSRAEWKSICDALAGAIKGGKARDGFIEAIARCGDLLAKHFPVQPGDVDELTNELRVID